MKPEPWSPIPCSGSEVNVLCKKKIQNLNFTTLRCIAAFCAKSNLLWDTPICHTCNFFGSQWPEMANFEQTKLRAVRYCAVSECAQFDSGLSGTLLTLTQRSPRQCSAWIGLMSYFYLKYTFSVNTFLNCATLYVICVICAKILFQTFSPSIAIKI